MDPIGLTLMMGLITSYILALQYGGQTHPWKSSLVIGLLVGSVSMVMVFVFWEFYIKERAMIVPRLVGHSALSNLLNGKTANPIGIGRS